MALAANGARDLLTPPRRGDSLIATLSAVTAEITSSSVPAWPAGQLGHDLLGDPLRLGALDGEPTRLGQRVEHGEGQGMCGIGIGTEGGRIELAEHLAERDRGAVPPVEQRDVGGQDRLVAHQLARGGQVDRGEGAGLQRPGQADGTPGRGWCLHLVDRVVVGEALGEIVGRVVVGHR